MEKSKRLVRAVVGVVFDQDNKSLLISKRQPTQSFAGYWELPGGKIEAEETLAAALKRELQEELGIIIGEFVYLGKHINYFTDYTVEVEICKIISFSNYPVGNEGQEIQWVDLDNIFAIQPLLPGSEEIINLIKIKH